MTLPIAVTHQEYGLIAFIFIMIGLFGAMMFLFEEPKDEEEDDVDNY